MASIESLMEKIADLEQQTADFKTQNFALLEKVALLEQENLKLRAMLDKKLQ